MKTSLILIIATLAIHSAYAREATTTVYKQVLPDGSVSYSDQASDRSETLEVSPVPTVPALETKNRSSRDDEEDDSDRNYKLSIASPENDSAFYSGNGSMSISVAIDPPLRRGHRLQLILDGQLVRTQSSQHFALDLVDRGTHQAQVNIVNRAGKILQSTQSRFTIHRPIVRNN